MQLLRLLRERVAVARQRVVPQRLSTFALRDCQAVLGNHIVGHEEGLFRGPVQGVLGGVNLGDTQWTSVCSCRVLRIGAAVTDVRATDDQVRLARGSLRTADGVVDG